MITIIYRKTDLRCVGSVMNNMTVEQEIEFNVIPNFGGNIEDYSFIETDIEKFHLEQENGEIVIVKDKINSIPKPEPQPTKEELQAQEIENLKKQLAICQQSIVELTALAAIGTPT
ncbi:hypothetical protein ACXAUS_003375 [Clostridium sporogenes]